MTRCPRGGTHHGLILSRCSRCGHFLTFADYARPEVYRGKIVVIKCIECGAEREVKPQDAWQVKRCKMHQAMKGKKSFAKFMKKVKGVKK